ncbi:hypothetical protein PG993_009898 [Apiospora rasikravindrae]|uniref:Uncharacterized protein n=1 Tax=Apiospora rasikravindrae TaxID=990691 RepID=A0ABR1SKP8_9PEZI
MPSFFGIVCFLLTLCLAVSGAPVGANEVDILLSKLPRGGYIIGFDGNGKPFVHTNLTDDSTSGTTSIGVGPPTPAVSSNPLLTSRTKDQWGCIGGEVVSQPCYLDLAEALGEWCDKGNMLPKHSILTWTGCPEMVQVYICNYGYAQNCLGSDLATYMFTIDTYCPSIPGSYAIGWFLQGSGDKTYGRGLFNSKGRPENVCNFN